MQRSILKCDISTQRNGQKIFYLVALTKDSFSVGSVHLPHLQSKYHPAFSFSRLMGVVSSALTYWKFQRYT